MSVEKMYGYFPGGDHDPRRFQPDREVNTPAEIAAWEAACAAWEKNDPLILQRSGRIVASPDGAAVAIVCGSHLGMGTYEVETPDDDGGSGEPVHAWQPTATAVACGLDVASGIAFSSDPARVDCIGCIDALQEADPNDDREDPRVVGYPR